MFLSSSSLIRQHLQTVLSLVVLIGVTVILMFNLQLDETGLFYESILSGIKHEFIGLSYVVLTLGSGMLLSQTKRFKQGFIALISGFSIGFLLSINFEVSRAIIESGILLSIVLLTMALFSRYFNNTCEINLTQTNAFKNLHNSALIAFGLLTISHGAAHGMDLPASNIASGFYIGMLISTIALYSVGKGITYLLNKYCKNSFALQRILACIVLCSVLFI